MDRFSGWRAHLGCPTIILERAEPAIAHQTDEYGDIGHITVAHAIQAALIRDVCEVG